MQIRFTPTLAELSRAWLVEYYRARGWGLLRLFGAPPIILIGLFLWRLGKHTAQPDLVPGFGAFCVGYGLYYALKPWLAVWLLRRRWRAEELDQREISLTLEDAGLRISDARGTSDISWEAVRGAGERARYVWIELAPGRRFTLPKRAVGDLAKLNARLRSKTRWLS